jgi:hypothetical protein
MATLKCHFRQIKRRLGGINLRGLGKTSMPAKLLEFQHIGAEAYGAVYIVLGNYVQLYIQQIFSNKLK